MTTPNPYAPPTADVQDFHDATGQVELADRGTRLAAFFVDSIIMACAWYLPVLIAVITASAAGQNDSAVLIGGGLLLGGIGFAVWCYFTVSYVKANGQSIAKRMLGIKVVRSDGSPISLGRIFWLRNVVNGFLAVIPIYQFVDWLFIFGEDRQCLHDKLADTIVVRA